MTNLDRVLRSRDITLLTKVHIVKAMVFPVVIYGCESWTVKKVEHQRIDAFELWCWRLLRVPRTARRSNKSILKEISPEYSSEGLMLKLKLQYFGHLMQRADTGSDPDAGKDWGWEKRATEDQMVGWHHQLSGHEFEQTLGDSEGQGKSGVLQSMGSQRAGHDWMAEQQQVVLVIKNPPAKAGDMRCGFNPWVGKIPCRRAWEPLQYSCLENPLERGACWAKVHRVAKSRT